MTARQRSLWNDLRLRLVKATTGWGQKAQLAKSFGVTPQSVNEWLSGESAPTAETTLRLLEWVKAEEAKQQKSRGSALTPPRPKTRKPIHANEKINRARKKR